MFALCTRAAAAAFAVLSLVSGASAAGEPQPVAVQFRSLDGTVLTGYLFSPAANPGAKTPAIVMMHGRAGPYSSAAQGRYDASTLSKRHAAWGSYWAGQGYAALLVDSFGARGYPAGFPIHSYDSRPEAVNEVTVRPLDAYGALAYLRSRSDIDAGRIALQGWSNGGSATIAALSDETLAANGLTPTTGFRGGVAFYPACGLHGRFDGGYRAYAPLRILAGDADEEVSAAHCARLVQDSAGRGSNIGIKVYPGATHGFDDPNAKRQDVAANAAATAHAVPAVTTYIRQLFGSNQNGR